MVKQHLNKEKVNMLFVIVNNFRWKSKNDKVKEKKFKRKILKVNEEILYFMMKSFKYNLLKTEQVIIKSILKRMRDLAC